MVDTRRQILKIGGGGGMLNFQFNIKYRKISSQNQTSERQVHSDLSSNIFTFDIIDYFKHRAYDQYSVKKYILKFLRKVINVLKISVITKFAYNEKFSNFY